MARGPKPFVQKIVWDVATRGYRKAKKQLTDYRREVGRSEEATEDLKDEVDDSSKRMSRSWGGVKKAAAAMATAVVAALSAIGTAMAGATREAVRFEEGMNEVATLLEGESGPALERFSEGLERIQRRLPVTTDLTKALYQTLSAGVSEENALEVVDVAAQAATAGLTDTKTAVDAITSALNAYGLEATEAEDVSDSFFSAVVAGKTTFGELAGVVGRVLPLASTLGIELDEVNAALATLTASGLKTEEAATALRGVLTKLIQNTQKFRDRGIEVQEVLSERGLVGVLREVQRQTGGSASEIRELFADVEGLNAVLALAGEQSDKFASALGRMQGNAGATQNALAEVNKGAGALWQTLKNQLTIIARTLGESVLPKLNAALKSMNETLNRASTTSTERLLSTLQQTEGIDPQVITRLQATVERQQALDQVRELKSQIESTDIAVGVDLGGEFSDLIRKDLSDTDLDSLKQQLDAVNRALEQRAQRIAELKAQGDPIPEGAGRRRFLLREARDGLVEGIRILSEYQAATERAEQAQARLKAALEETGSAASAVQAAVDAGFLEPISTLFEGNSSSGGLSPQEIREAAEAFEQARGKLSGFAKELRRAAEVREAFTETEAQALEDLFGVQDQLQKLARLEAQFREEAAGATGEQREAAVMLLDQTAARRNELEQQKEELKAQIREAEELERIARRINAGFGPRPDGAGLQAFDLFGDRPAEQQQRMTLITNAVQTYRQEITRLRNALDAGQIKASDFAQQQEAAAEDLRSRAKELLKLYRALGVMTPQMEEAFRRAFEAAKDGAEESTEEAAEFLTTLDAIGQGLGAIRRLTGAFGDMSDELSDVLDGTEGVLSSMRSLFQLQQSDAGLFGSATNAIASATSILGGIGGLVQIGSGIASATGLFGGGDDDREKRLRREMAKLRGAIESNTQALNDQLEETIESPMPFGDVDQGDFFDAGVLLENAPVRRGSEQEKREYLAQLEGTGIELFQNATEMFEDQLKLEGDDPFADRNALAAVVQKLESRFREAEELYGQFGNSIQGLIEEIQFRREQMGQSFDELSDVIVNRLSDTQFSDRFKEGLSEILGNIDLSDQSVMDRLVNALSTILIEDDRTSDAAQEAEETLKELLPEDADLTQAMDMFAPLVGDASPEEYRRLLEFLQGLPEQAGSGEEAGSDFTASTAVDQTITEFQANRLLAYQQNLLAEGRTHTQLLRSIASAVGGDAGVAQGLGYGQGGTSSTPGRSGIHIQDLHIAAGDTPESIARKIGEAAESEIDYQQPL